MRRRRTVFLAALGAAALAAIGCAPDARSVAIRIDPPEAIGCRPSALTRVRVQPLGDVPVEQRALAFVVEVGAEQRIDAFPDATEAVAVDAEGVIRMGASELPWRGGGLATLVEGERVVPLLRFGRACALADAAARVPRAAAVTALPDRALFVAGGLDGASEASQRVVVVRVGRPLATSLSLLVPRAGATATVLDDGRVLVAGGTGLATDSVELFDVAEGAEERVENEELLGSRRDHVAVRAGDGSVLLVGGLDRDGAVRADGERVRVDARDVSTAPVPGLAVARAGHHAIALDDGIVLVVGGVDGSGALVSTVERLAGDRFEPIAALPPRADAAYAALAGARAAQVGGRDGDTWSTDVELLLDGGVTPVTLAGVLVVPGTEGSATPVPIEAPAAVGLVDGRLLVVGRDPRSGLPTARVIDPGGTREAEAVDPSRVAAHLVRLSDGTIAEGDGDGLSLLRLDLANTFSDPPATIFPGQPHQLDALSLDAAPHWTADADGLAATRDGARMDVPAARFGDVEIELDVRVEGDDALELRMTPDGAAPAVVAVTADRVAHGECGVVRTEGGAVVVRRRDDRVALEADGAATECALAVTGRVGIALRAATAGATVRRLAVSRLAPP